jgi:DNA-binding transcriptional LysR family regulator
MKALTKSGIENCRDNIRREFTEIRMVDLNLFRVFDAMMQDRTVRAASRRLSVTPSAVSHALRRLRQSLRDELFVSTESSMQPTRRALEIAPTIREGLEKLELALVRKEPNRPEALRTFRIVATDYAWMVILPRLVKRLSGSAPRVALQVSARNHLDLGQNLQTGRCDLFIGPFDKLQAGLRRSKLLSDDEVIAVRNAHPLTLGEVTKIDSSNSQICSWNPRKPKGVNTLVPQVKRGSCARLQQALFCEHFVKRRSILPVGRLSVCHILLRWFLCFS